MQWSSFQVNFFPSSTPPTTRETIHTLHRHFTFLCHIRWLGTLLPQNVQLDPLFKYFSSLSTLKETESTSLSLNKRTISFQTIIIILLTLSQCKNRHFSFQNIRNYLFTYTYTTKHCSSHFHSRKIHRNFIFSTNISRSPSRQPPPSN